MEKFTLLGGGIMGNSDFCDTLPVYMDMCLKALGVLPVSDPAQIIKKPDIANHFQLVLDDNGEPNF